MHPSLPDHRGQDHVEIGEVWGSGQSGLDIDEVIVVGCVVEEAEDEWVIGDC